MREDRTDEVVPLPHFRLLGPSIPFNLQVPPFSVPLFGTLAASLIERANTYFSPGVAAPKVPFEALAVVPRQSTFTIASIVNCLVRQMPDDSAYLNIGVWNGFTLLAGMLANPTKTVVGVDNFSMFGGPREQFLRRFNRFRTSKHFFYDMDFREFLGSSLVSRVGVYYFDGPHGYADQFDALNLVHPLLIENAVVLVDDTNWTDPRKATLDFLESHSREYEIVLDVKTRTNGHPTFWNGLMVLRKAAH